MISVLLIALTLIGGNIVSSFRQALYRYGKYDKKKRLSLFFFKSFFENRDFESIYFVTGVTKNLLFLSAGFFSGIALGIKSLPLFLALALFLDFSFRLIATIYSRGWYFFSAPIAGIYIILLSPISYLLLHLSKTVYRKIRLNEKPSYVKEKLREFLKDTGLVRLLEPSDQRILSSLITFKEKTAREIMIPRIDLFALPAETPISLASKQILEEGYSRVPVFKETPDNIIGVLMYKDLLQVYAQKEDLDAPVEKLIKPVLYAPENKKISHLFQEFKSKQSHMAIIVNEYGATEGIVTIEDILEELVGEIEDEYDIEEERQFWKISPGKYIVDAKMSILDIEHKLNIKIPSSPEYETIGGYVFHRAGTIPSKGWKLCHDDFDLEVLISNERCIEKISITLPTFAKQ